MRRPNKSELVLSLAVTYCGIIALITPTLIDKAYMTRGYLDFGGEIIPLFSIPFVLLFAAAYVLFNL